LGRDHGDGITIIGLVDAANTVGVVEVVAIAIPIGQPAVGPRRANDEARAHVGPQAGVAGSVMRSSRAAVTRCDVTAVEGRLRLCVTAVQQNSATDSPA